MIFIASMMQTTCPTFTRLPTFTYGCAAGSGDWVEFVPQLPRAPGPAGPGTGKLLRRVLREQAGRG